MSAYMLQWNTVSGDYELMTTYCEPDSGPGSVLQVMTHGIGFDRTYWDFPAQDYKYSYVARAVDDYGYSTLTWDRLGVGMSSHGETINEIQLFLEIAALKELTTMLAEGTVCNKAPAYNKIVHLGHSFGSAMTYGLVKSYPEISAGIILTGFSQVAEYMGHFALGGNFMPVKELPLLKGKYHKGYVAAGSKMAMQQNFFGPGDFDPEILDYLHKHAQPNTPGEIITVGAGGGDMNNFPGPSMVITGGKFSFWLISNITNILRPRCALLRWQLHSNRSHSPRVQQPHRGFRAILPQGLSIQRYRRP